MSAAGRPGRILRVLLGFYFLEAGLLLVLAPWGRFWVRRIVLPAPDSLAPFLASPWLRGFVTGLGVLHVLLAVRELLGGKEASG
jgi:hypothetical protein